MAKVEIAKRADTIATIAEHFTGPLVAHHSILLAQGGPHRVMAQKFFEARQKLGIQGYSSKEEAIRTLEDLLKA